MESKYVLMGGGGLALELFEYMSSEGNPPVGYYALEEDEVLSCFLKWLGDEHKADVDPSAYYIVASGILGIRNRIINFLESHHLTVGSFTSRYAYVSSLAKFGKGFVAIPSSTITGNPVIGDYVLCNGGSIGHDAHLGDNVVVGPGVRITGACQIGDNVALGANAALIPGTVIESSSEIGILTFPRKKVKKGKVIVSAPGTAIQ